MHQLLSSIHVCSSYKGVIKGSAVGSYIKLIRDTADLPHHSKVISIVERVKQEIGRNRNFKKHIHELARNLNNTQRKNRCQAYTVTVLGVSTV